MADAAQQKTRPLTPHISSPPCRIHLIAPHSHPAHPTVARPGGDAAAKQEGVGAPQACQPEQLAELLVGGEAAGSEPGRRQQ